MEITQKVLKRGLSFFYATHRHDMFYITVKYHPNIPNGIQVIERTRKCLWMDVQTDEQTLDGRQAHRYIPRTFRLGDKNSSGAVSTMPTSILISNSNSVTDDSDEEDYVSDEDYDNENSPMAEFEFDTKLDYTDRLKEQLIHFQNF